MQEPNCVSQTTKIGAEPVLLRHGVQCSSVHVLLKVLIGHRLQKHNEILFVGVCRAHFDEMIISCNFGENFDFVLICFLRLCVVAKTLRTVDAFSCVHFSSRFADDLVHDGGAVAVVSAVHRNLNAVSSTDNQKALLRTLLHRARIS